ncbi:hypothetical protein NDU88_001058 [Pleurodeles waltl]|uniref:Uncharacterized protein n=1 Tax=Pleurodeles waltl TaxID=8319 RepID=A0AAV7Q203_PLEWA|nr:hypothetical protein NDU88_001058 [Pleurodeles waltl]
MSQFRNPLIVSAHAGEHGGGQEGDGAQTEPLSSHFRSTRRFKCAHSSRLHGKRPGEDRAHLRLGRACLGRAPSLRPSSFKVKATPQVRHSQWGTARAMRGPPQPVRP